MLASAGSLGRRHFEAMHVRALVLQNLLNLK
jgi:hypothetical protein